MRFRLDNFPTDREIIDKLDAYGKRYYSVGYSDEGTKDSVCECKEPRLRYSSMVYQDISEQSIESLCEECGLREHRGDWLASFDFCVYSCPDGMKIAYHAIISSNSSGYMQETESGFVDCSKAPFDLPSRYLRLTLFPDEIEKANRCNASWNKDIKKEIEEMSNMVSKEFPLLDPCRLN